ncbi:hypothetical protein FSP39_006964 [Pinctada imbricata]|uniref:B box-type domain-containing protein n=1 Tax=Pinctada imbricata TaxID=66713 RepID=A0AA88YJ74_PINIB|nr:hypothetical protein FSP39_006964 [Pinctada imbricata]
MIQKPDGIDIAEWGKSFPLNHLMVNIMDCESLKEGRLCNSCRRENETESATNWCVECRDPLCQNCTKWHRRFRNSENHKIIPISEVDQNFFPSISIMQCQKHPDRMMEAFCSDHNVQCCLACITLDHRKCEDIGTVEAAAEKLRKSQSLRTLEKDLSNIEGSLKELANEKEENINELKTTTTKIKAEVLGVRKRIDSHLDKLQNETLNELSKVEENTIPDLEVEKDEIECQQSIISCGLKILRTGLQFASDAQLLDEVAKIKDAKLKVDQYLSKSRRSQVYIQYQTSKEVLDIETLIAKFGNVSTTECKGILKMDLLKGAAKKILEFRTSYDKSGFTGAVILSDDKVLVAQYNARSLEMYSPKGNMVSKLCFDGHPWCVEMIGDKSGVMTVYNNHMLVFFNIINDQLVETKRKSFQTYCYDIRYHDNKLFMACNTEIMILDSEGTNIGKISPLSSQARFLDIDPRGETLCYSSNSCHTVTCISIDGSETFTYRSDQLSNSSSTARDFAGNIYVVGHSSGNIHQLDQKGRFNKVIVTGLSCSHVLRFKKHSNKFITNSKGTAILYEIVEQ